MKVVAQYKDGKKLEGVATPRAQVAAERKFNEPLSVLFAVDAEQNRLPRVEVIYYLTWAALHYSDQEPETDWEKWLDLVAEAGIEPGEDDAGGKATPRARSRKKSST
jgi:hypothetical protein